MGAKRNETFQILIADDSATVRKFVSNALLTCGENISIEQVDNGESCLENLSNFAYDLAFIDVNMPGLTGIDALAEARRKGSKTFVIIMSTESDEQKIKKVRSLSAYEYLSKPFSVDQIKNIVKNFQRLSTTTSLLLVDDSRSTRHVIEKVLQNSQFDLEIDEVRDGPSALVAYQKKHHELIFLDINMPGINGFDTLYMLRKINPEVSIILITADRNKKFPAFDDKAQSLTELLYKPFFTEDVNRVLHKVFSLKPPQLALATKAHVKTDEKII